MRITLLLVGKTTNKHLEALVEDYCGRIGHYLPFEVKIIPELKSTKSLTVEQQKEKEGELILQHIRQGDRLILLDERGKQYRSVDFAAFLTKQCSMSAKRIVFLIGGPYGFSKAVYEKSHSMLSLSLMTFSHQMIRLLFVEQLYRALTIQNGEPYHHEG